MPELSVALCQINTVVGDLDGNSSKVIDYLVEAERLGCDLAVFPELTITGYPPEDLLLKPGFVRENVEALERVAKATADLKTVGVVGFVDPSPIGVFDAAAVIAKGWTVDVYHKQRLPNYSVFDEKRYFRAGTGEPILFKLAGVIVGLAICEDVWVADGPVPGEAKSGAQLIAVLNSSPYYDGRLAERQLMLAERAATNSCTIAYVNQVGGQDELIFDGGSMVCGPAGELVASSSTFAEEITAVRLHFPEPTGIGNYVQIDDAGKRSKPARPAGFGTTLVHLEPENITTEETRPPDLAAMYAALVMGTRDYVEKNGFSEVVIGLSGGIDSSLVATIAVDALGPDRVHGVSMPSRYSSRGSVDDAKELAQNLGIDLQEVPIEEVHRAFSASLAGVLGVPGVGRLSGLTDENLQSRIRGVILMAISNAKGWLVLTTGNKSEMAVGYSTLYGDSAGGFAVIKDVLKTTVFKMSEWRNDQAEKPVIPEAVILKPPSAELREDQRDDQSLPPYEVLDPILKAYIEDDMTAEELVYLGFDPGLISRVVSLVDRAEYKRRQMPPGVRVTTKAFGKDRRMPITVKPNRWGP